MPETIIPEDHNDWHKFGAPCCEGGCGVRYEEDPEDPGVRLNTDNAGEAFSDVPDKLYAIFEYELFDPACTESQLRASYLHYYNLDFWPTPQAGGSNFSEAAEGYDACTQPLPDQGRVRYWDQWDEDVDWRYVPDLIDSVLGQPIELSAAASSQCQFTFPPLPNPLSAKVDLLTTVTDAAPAGAYGLWDGHDETHADMCAWDGGTDYYVEVGATPLPGFAETVETKRTAYEWEADTITYEEYLGQSCTECTGPSGGCDCGDTRTLGRRLTGQSTKDVVSCSATAGKQYMRAALELGPSGVSGLTYWGLTKIRFGLEAIHTVIYRVSEDQGWEYSTTHNDYPDDYYDITYTPCNTGVEVTNEFNTDPVWYHDSGALDSESSSLEVNARLGISIEYGGKWPLPKVDYDGEIDLEWGTLDYTEWYRFAGQITLGPAYFNNPAGFLLPDTDATSVSLNYGQKKAIHPDLDDAPSRYSPEVFGPVAPEAWYPSNLCGHVFDHPDHDPDNGSYVLAVVVKSIRNAYYALQQVHPAVIVGAAGDPESFSYEEADSDCDTGSNEHCNKFVEPPWSKSHDQTYIVAGVGIRNIKFRLVRDGQLPGDPCPGD